MENNRSGVLAQYPPTAQWADMFNQKLKLRTFEQFSLLLCDVDKCSPAQRDLLYPVLFVDHKSSTFWLAYVQFIVTLHEDRKLQLQRLVNKALELVEESTGKDDRPYTTLHLISAQLKQDAKDSLKYFQNVIWKKEIGRRIATIFTTWANYEMATNNKSGAIDILQKGLLCGAEPRQLITLRLQEINNIDAQQHMDDDEIELKSTMQKPSNNSQDILRPAIACDSSEPATKDDALGSFKLDDSLDVTETVKISLNPNTAMLLQTTAASNRPSRVLLKSSTANAAENSGHPKTLVATAAIAMPNPTPTKHTSNSFHTNSASSIGNSNSSNLSSNNSSSKPKSRGSSLLKPIGLSSLGQCKRVSTTPGSATKSSPADDHVSPSSMSPQAVSAAGGATPVMVPHIQVTSTSLLNSMKPMAFSVLADVQEAMDENDEQDDVNQVDVNVNIDDEESQCNPNSNGNTNNDSVSDIEISFCGGSAEYSTVSNTSNQFIESRNTARHTSARSSSSQVENIKNTKRSRFEVHETQTSNVARAPAAISSSKTDSSSVIQSVSSNVNIDSKVTAKPNLKALYLDDKLINFNPFSRLLTALAISIDIETQNKEKDLGIKQGEGEEVSSDAVTQAIPQRRLQPPADMQAAGKIQMVAANLKVEKSKRKRVSFAGNNEEEAPPRSQVLHAPSTSSSSSSSSSSSTTTEAAEAVAPPVTKRSRGLKLQQQPSTTTTEHTNTDGAAAALQPHSYTHSNRDSATASTSDSSNHATATSQQTQSSQKTPVSSSSSSSHTAPQHAGIFTDSNRYLTLNGKTYVKLGVLGKGGSSCVYRVLCEDDGNIYAYKRVNIHGSAGGGGDADDISSAAEAVLESYVNEIELLRRLKGTSPYIIDLVDAEVNRVDMYVAMVMEVGEIDLAKVLQQRQRKAPATGSGQPVGSSSSSSSNVADFVELNPFFVRLIWTEMLEAVDHIHQHRIVHGDLKPANFVFVKGHLKLIDFGIAKAFSNDTTNIYRESQVGTVNYMAPEAIAPMLDGSHASSPSHPEASNDAALKMRLGRPSDVWSLGCILYQMLFGRPPFAALNTIQKLHAIPNDKHEIRYPPHADSGAVDSIRACLVRDPRKRCTIRGPSGLLNRPFLTLTALETSGSISATAITNAAMNNNNVAEKTTMICGASADNEWDVRKVKQVVSVLMQEMHTTSDSNHRDSSVIDALSHRVHQRLSQLTYDHNNNSSDVGYDSDSSADQTTAPLANAVAAAAVSAPVSNRRNKEKTVTFKPKGKENATMLAVSTMVATKGTPKPTRTPIHSNTNNGNTSTVKSAPLKTLPAGLQAQILSLSNIRSNNNANGDNDNNGGCVSVDRLLVSKESSRGNKWMRPKGGTPVKDDLKSVLEKKIGALRKFMYVDEENNTMNNDFTEEGSFFR